MDIQHFNKNKASNVLPFNKTRQRTKARPQPHSATSKNKTIKTLKKLLNIPLQLVRITATLLFFVTSSLFQTVLRIVYGGILTIGLGLLAFAAILTLSAGGKTPANFWPVYQRVIQLSVFFDNNPGKVKSYLPNNLEYDSASNSLTHEYFGGEKVSTRLNELSIPPVDPYDEALWTSNIYHSRILSCYLQILSYSKLI